MEIVDLYPPGSKILIIGSYPPPLGGVSVHIYRLEKQLKRKGCSPTIFDISRNRPVGTKIFQLLIILIFRKWDFVHLHTAAPAILGATKWVRKVREYKTVFTDHNPRLFVDKKRPQIEKLKKFIENTDKLILVTEQIVNNYITLGIKLPKEWYIKEAFLPPPLNEEKCIVKSYPEALSLFIKNHSPLLFANAYQLNFFNHEDLYGLDMCVELSFQLKKKYPNHGFLFAIANDNYNQNYFIQIKEKIKKQSLSDNFYFLTGQYEIWPLFKKVNLFIRPTNTDGDAISVREALFFHVPVVASDTCQRPRGSIMFRSRDGEDLLIKTNALISTQTEE